MEYEKLILSSFKAIRKNLILFIPNIITMLISALLLGIFIYTLGIQQILSDPSILNNQDQIKELLISLLSDKANIIKFSIMLFIGFLIYFIISSYMDAVKYKYISNIIKNKKTKLDFAINKQILSLIYLRLLIMLISLGPLVFFMVLTVLISSVSEFLAIISGILTILSFIFLVLTVIVFFFKYPLMFISNLSPVKIISSSYNIFKKNWKTILILEIILIAVGLLISLLTIPIGLLQSISFLYFPSMIIKNLISIISILFADIFIFSSYKEL